MPSTTSHASERPVTKDRLLSVKQVAEYLHNTVSPHTVRRLIERGELPTVRIGRSVRVRVSDIETMIERGGSR